MFLSGGFERGNRRCLRSASGEECRHRRGGVSIEALRRLLAPGPLEPGDRARPGPSFSYASPVSEALAVKRANELCTDLLPMRGEVRAVARFVEGSITGAYRIDFVDADATPAVVKVYPR